MSDLIIDPKLIEYFKKLVQNRSLAHSYIFSGIEMIGKRSFAFEVYKMANSLQDVKESDPDFKFVTSDKEESDKITIEQIRRLKSFMSLKPYTGPYKFTIIDNAHCLTAEASNALLKILEEPPRFSVIILVTPLPNSLPETIRSRCQEIKFHFSTKSAMADFVEKHGTRDGDADFIIKMSGGRIGLASRLLDKDNLAMSKKNIEDLRKIFKADLSDRLDFAKKMAESKNIQSVVNDWFWWLYTHRANFSSYPVLQKLLNLNQTLSHSGLNQRLALENFLISL